MMNNAHQVIVVLGYKNFANGELHPIARQRAEKAFEIAKDHDARLLCTGGFGDNFNQSDVPHGVLLQQYLEAKGMPPQRFLPHAASRNTYEDGRFCAEILAPLYIDKILLVTSDFHIKRGFLWLYHFCPEMDIVCCPAKTIAPDIEMKSLLVHEAQAIPKFYQDFPYTPPLEELYNFDDQTGSDFKCWSG